MGYIANIFAQRALDLCEDDPRESARLRPRLLERAGISEEALAEASGVLSDTRFFALLEAVAESGERGRSLGLRIGASMRCDDYGAFGLAFKSATNLAGSFRCIERYGQVVTDVANFTVTRSGASTWMSVPAAASGRLGEIMTIEIALAAATALSREVGGEDFRPQHVAFIHDAGKGDGFAQSYFRCPVRYAAERNGIAISDAALDTGNRLGDEAIATFFARHLDAELRERIGAPTLVARVTRLVSRSLSQGPPGIEDIAEQLGMSRRTLQRRLADEGSVYLDVVDQARNGLATSLLRDKRHSLAEVAFLVGYGDQSAFTRAFRRWEGRTPAEFRRASAGG